MIEWRQAIPGDAGAIRDLVRAAYAKWVPIIGREPKPMGADYDAAVCAHRFDLIYLDSALAGLIETVDEEGVLLIENVAVAPALQGQGIGTKLMAHAEAVARAQGYTRICLYTNKRFTENIKLYLRLGYTLDGEEQIDEHTARVDMSKAL
jgi:GNAT superfamily N-acetyltransferase